jgi:hypothetical protein
MPVIVYESFDQVLFFIKTDKTARSCVLTVMNSDSD